MTPCWLYAGTTNQAGYGQINVGKTTQVVHRIVYENEVGLIPKNMTLDHLCETPQCINPGHMEIVTLAENIARGKGVSSINRAKTHCSNGHEFTSKNTRYYHKPKIWRTCWTCTSIRLNNRQRIGVIL